MTLEIQIRPELLYLSPHYSSDHFICNGRADELEVALMEMVKQDNRRHLNAKVFSHFLFIYLFKNYAVMNKDNACSLYFLVWGVD